MATTVFNCGFECGVGPTSFPHFDITAGSASIQTDIKRGGLRALRCNAGTFATWAGPNNAHAVGRVYLYINTLGTPVDRDFIEFLNSSGTMSVYYQASDSTIRGYCGTVGSQGVAVSTGQWIRIDFHADLSTNQRRLSLTINGTALSTVLGSGTATTFTGIRLWGFGTGNDVYYDDFIASVTEADYPIGTGFTKGYVPASDGTHTSTATNIVKGTAGVPVGAAIVSGTTDSNEWVNARPIGGGATDATRLINQQATAAAQYVEHGIEQEAVETGDPRAVEVLVGYQQAATQSGSSTFKVNDNGTENTVVALSGAGVASDRFSTKHYATMPTGGGAWTLARLKALKLRFGYSGDAAPDQYLRGWMVEAEYPGDPAGGGGGNAARAMYNRRLGR